MPLYDCISLKLETCEEWHKRVHIRLLVGCVIESYDTYFGGHVIQEEDPVWRVAHEGNLIWKIARFGINHCYNKHRDRGIRSSPFEIKWRVSISWFRLNITDLTVYRLPRHLKF